MRIGFVGFGEAGFHIARGLAHSGAGPIAAYDLHTHTPGRGEQIRTRAEAAGVRLLESPAELAAASDLILSTVTADQAEAAAGQAALHLKPRHLFADLNSVSPAAKQSIERTISGAGARFAEVAIMSPVAPHGHRVPLLAGGAGAQEFAAALAPFGMRIEVVSPEVGLASATKMFRSIVVKGLEALLTECVLGAGRYGAVDRVIASLNESYPGLDWGRLLDYALGRVVVHGERRAREMEEVAATLRSIGIEPLMAEATARRMDHAAALGLKERFHGRPPSGYREFLDAVGPAARATVQSEDKDGRRHF